MDLIILSFYLLSGSYYFYHFVTLSIIYIILTYFLKFPARDDGDSQIFKQRIETKSYPKDEAMHKIDDLFKVPQCIWENLYRYNIYVE